MGAMRRRTRRVAPFRSHARRVLVPSVVVAGVFAFAPRAIAIDTLRERIRVDFGEVPCMERIVRSTDTDYTFNWSISSEESYPIPSDEVPGGRTHQILAIARQEAKQLPTWVSQADVDASAAIVPDFGVPSDEDIFERSPNWPAPSWLRVTPDDPRIEITDANAQAGATWDTTDVPPGAYQLVGYTFDPPVNITSRREGLLKVVDGDENGAPALFIEPRDVAVTLEGTTLGLQACIDAAPDSTLTGYIGEVVASDAPIDWQEVDLEVANLPSRGGFELGVRVPFGAGGNPLRNYRVRVDVQDVGGASYTAYSPRVYAVAEDPDAPGETGDGGSGPGGGCSIASNAEGGRLAFWLGLGWGLVWRRRRG